MHRSTRLALAVLTAGSLALAGCGSDGGDEEQAATTSAPEETTTTVDADAEFADAFNEACATGDEAATAASEDFDDAIERLGLATEAEDDAAYATALDDAETAVEDIIAAVEEFDATVGELDVPTELTQPVDDYLEAMGTQLALAEQLRLAIVADDGQAFNEAVEQIQQAEEATNPVRTSAAEEIGAPECVPDDADGSTGTGDDTTGTTAKG